MKRPALFLALVFSALLPAGSFGGQVPHHGRMAESEGTATHCLGCHDGLSAKAVSYCTVNCDVTSGSHAIEVKYPPSKKRNSYAPVEAVTAKGVKLVNGKVTCISCHDLKNPARFHLIKNSTRELCSVCHFRIRHPRGIPGQP